MPLVPSRLRPVRLVRTVPPPGPDAIPAVTFGSRTTILEYEWRTTQVWSRFDTGFLFCVCPLLLLLLYNICAPIPTAAETMRGGRGAGGPKVHGGANGLMDLAIYVDWSTQKDREGPVINTLHTLLIPAVTKSPHAACLGKYGAQIGCSKTRFEAEAD